MNNSNSSLLSFADKDLEWSNSCMQLAKTEVVGDGGNPSDKVFTARILLSLGANTIWVRRLHCLERIKTREEDHDEDNEGRAATALAPTCELRRALLESDLVDENHAHLDLLQKLCQNVRLFLTVQSASFFAQMTLFHC